MDDRQKRIICNQKICVKVRKQRIVNASTNNQAKNTSNIQRM